MSSPAALPTWPSGTSRGPPPHLHQKAGAGQWARSFAPAGGAWATAYIRARGGAGAHSLAVGAPGFAAYFLLSVSAPPAPLVDNLLFADRTMTLEEVRCQDTVPESTARWVDAGCRKFWGAGFLAMPWPQLVGREALETARWEPAADGAMSAGLGARGCVLAVGDPAALRLVPAHRAGSSAGCREPGKRCTSCCCRRSARAASLLASTSPPKS